MKINLNVNVHHLTRVEGHGNIHVKVENGNITDARWEVVETPRYFEVMLKGKHYTTAAPLTSRICGICSIGHTLASLRATENSFGVKIPQAAKLLRLLAKHGETLQSHYLHLFFLAAPDFLGLPSALPLLQIKPEVVELAARLKGLANNLCDIVAGRTTHPVSLLVGGVSKMPSEKELLDIQTSLNNSVADLEKTVEIFQTFEIPDFIRKTEFVSLKGKTDYPFIGGNLVSTDGVELPESDYLKMTNEYAVKQHTSKLCKLSREAFAVGALARFNNNYKQLQPAALDIASLFNLKATCHNPFMNNVAQLVECVHVTYESIKLIDQLLENLKAETMCEVLPRESEGVGAVEVPRGILYHHYKFDDKGKIIKANCIIPTTQNNANIHLDIVSLAKQFSSKNNMTDGKLSLLCEMLVRAYDPCISCSVH